MNHNQVTVQKLIDSKDYPEAGPVKTYRLEEEFETKIARNLQTIIKAGKLPTGFDLKMKRYAINEIIVACCKELNEMDGIEGGFMKDEKQIK